MNDLTIKSRFDKFEKEQIAHNKNLENLTKEVHTMNLRMDRDFYAFPNGALHKFSGVCKQIWVHWLLIFAILGFLTWKQYTP